MGYASEVIETVFTIEAARALCTALRDATERQRCDPDEVRFIPDLMTTLAADRRTVLDRRIALTGRTFPERVIYPQHMLRVCLDPSRFIQPLSYEKEET